MDNWHADRIACQVAVKSPTLGSLVARTLGGKSKIQGKPPHGTEHIRSCHAVWDKRAVAPVYLHGGTRRTAQVGGTRLMLFEQDNDSFWPKLSLRSHQLQG
jgi:hypothetical protein